MVRFAALAAVVGILLPGVAAALPAVVRVFEAPARAEPSAAAAVVQVFPEKAEVSVSEEAREGWRRVRLKDGGVGWIEERALAFPEGAAVAVPVPASLPPTSLPPASPPPAAAAPAAPAGAGGPDLRARIYVKDLGHLAELVRSDPNVSPKAEGLASRRRVAIGAFVVGGVGATALLVASLAKQTPDPGDPRFDSAVDDKMKLMLGGTAVGLAGALVGALVHPRRGELLDVLNEWNVAHPDRPFVLNGPGEIGR